ncbi:NUDIX domain-containing protein [Candidatus Woesearchaeota archaeon]|nr:NUDIX domain-containing protein [Candidatus Woesearchaeota archaeon]
MAEQQFPEPGVGAVIVNAEGKIFLMKSPKWHDAYVIPGGHVELGETMVEALKREMREETGLAVDECEFLGVQDCIYPTEFWKKKHFLLIDFACKTKSNDVTLNAEGHDHVWVTVEEALRLSLNPFTRRAIETYRAKHPGGKR